MIALDGRFLACGHRRRASSGGPDERTPFAVVTRFEPSVDFDLDGPLSQDELLAAIDERLLGRGPRLARSAWTASSRRSGRARCRARRLPTARWPRWSADQHEFELGPVDGTMVGFRFPEYAEGIEVSGYHLHFVSADRSRGGHVLDSRAGRCASSIDPSRRPAASELPPGDRPGRSGVAASTHAAIELVERGVRTRPQSSGGAARSRARAPDDDPAASASGGRTPGTRRAGPRGARG